MNLTDPGTLRALLARHGVAARKGLGQHFLCSEKVVRVIVGQFDGMAGVLEIGPGPGLLTAPLTQRVERVLALEVDPGMLPVLAETSPLADVRLQDALHTNLSELLATLPEPRGIVSNLPYYITAPLLQAVAEARKEFDKAVLMMQKEVGERVIAPAGDRRRGSLSVYLQACFGITKVATVPPGAFLPPPKVESVVLVFEPRLFEVGGDPERFFRWVRAGFSQPRKTLANNLSTTGVDRKAASAHFEAVGLSASARASDLTLEQWVAAYQALVPPR